MKLFISIILTAIFLVSSIYLFGQSATQTMRGNVSDQITQQPLPFAHVILNDTLLATTDEFGDFRFEGLSIGKHHIQLRYLGYEDGVVNNIQVNAGKETILSLKMSEAILQISEVVVSANKEKSKPLNEMALLSTRMVSVEETQRYAASFSDPARMANSFAGVVQTDAGNNHIAIRGNAPNGLLWRMEGIDIPNPNHFSYVSTSGGGVSILSAQLLANSDFSTGAFGAEYGNALSGVFDIKLRKGNNENREYTFQLGALGVDLAAEGPFKKGSKNSFLVNYRYSTLGLLSKVIPLGDNITNFQDLSYNMAFRDKKWGDFTIFGINGLSDQISKDSIFDQNYHFVSNTFVNGVTHNKTLGTKSFLRTALVFSNTINRLLVDEDDKNNIGNQFEAYNENHNHKKVTISTKLQHKLSAKTSLKLGIIQSALNYKLSQVSRDSANAETQQLFSQNGSTSLSQIYFQGQHRYSDKVTANFGMHFMYNWLNNTKSLEPRAAFKYSPHEGHNITFGYGLHSQILPLSTYFVEVMRNDKPTLVNKNLKMSKAHHLVLGYSVQPSQLFNIKTEIYFQSLFDIPQGLVAIENISLINLEFGTPDVALENKGIGRNFGIEFTIEKYLNRGLYYTFTSSLYDSKFKGTDGNWYNTRFNGNFTSTFTGGKEFKISKKNDRVMAINLKVIYTGGLRQNTIDLDKSIIENKTVYDTEHPFNVQMKNFLRTDLKLIIKRNFKHVTSSLVFDIQNIGNVQNVNGQFYNPKAKKIDNYVQIGLLPVISYKLEF